MAAPAGESKRGLGFGFTGVFRLRLSVSISTSRYAVTHAAFGEELWLRRCRSGSGASVVEKLFSPLRRGYRADGNSRRFFVPSSTRGRSFRKHARPYCFQSFLVVSQ